MKQALEVYDLECLSNLFTYTGYNCTEKRWYQFVICRWRDDTNALIEHILNKDCQLIQVGFNNLSYDYPLLHHLIRHYKEFGNGEMFARDLYKKSQEIIATEFSTIAEKNCFIKQIDLYKIWHYNNAARRQNLKGLEIQMRMENVEEMPLPHFYWCKQGDEKLILEYNKNDVLATYKFLLVTLGKTDYPLYKGRNKLQLRQDLNKKFGVNVLNMGDVPMGEELILQLYSRASGVPTYTLKKSGGTPRPQGINLKDCVPSWCNIKSKEFNVFLDKVKNTTITGAKGEFTCPIIFHNYQFDFAQGGMHGSCQPQVWESNDEWVIADYDVGLKWSN